MEEAAMLLHRRRLARCSPRIRSAPAAAAGATARPRPPQDPIRPAHQELAVAAADGEKSPVEPDRRSTKTRLLAPRPQKRAGLGPRHRRWSTCHSPPTTSSPSIRDHLRSVHNCDD